MVVKWEFYDPIVLETYTFHINPNSGGSPAYRKNIAYQNTSAPDGKVLIFEGKDHPGEMEFSGVILEEAQLTAFQTWWQKRRQVRLTDDLGREYWIYITELETTRRWSLHYPWRHDYSVKATILDWT